MTSDRTMTSSSVAILAGGEGRRMGRDKAKLTYDGETFLERVAGQARRVGSTIVVGRNDAEEFDLPDVEFVSDREAGLGPIGGLLTALDHVGGPVVSLGCDMPKVDATAIAWLLEAFEEANPPAGLVVETDDGLQPLFGIYRPRVTHVVEAMIDDGQRSLHRLVERADVDVREAPDFVARRLVNINTPEEFRAL